MSKPDKLNINIAEIPKGLEKEDVIKVLKEKLGVDEEGAISCGNFNEAYSKVKEEVLPYKWGIFKFRKEEVH